MWIRLDGVEVSDVGLCARDAFHLAALERAEVVLVTRIFPNQPTDQAAYTRYQYLLFVCYTILLGSSKLLAQGYALYLCAASVYPCARRVH